jgi:hypothetical protein
MADVSVRRSQHLTSKAAEEEEEQLKKVTSALEYVVCICYCQYAALIRPRYLKERFGWTEVTEEAIDNVIDNCDSMELGLDDRCKQAVRHAIGQDKAVVFAYVVCSARRTHDDACFCIPCRPNNCRYQLRKVDFLSFAAEKERQRLQKIALKRSEAISETESVVQPSKVEWAFHSSHFLLHSLLCSGHRRRRSGAVYDAHAATC